jgi:hypothetical protein
VPATVAERVSAHLTNNPSSTNSSGPFPIVRDR